MGTMMLDMVNGDLSGADDFGLFESAANTGGTNGILSARSRTAPAPRMRRSPDELSPDVCVRIT